MIGGKGADRSTPAWRQVYRALEHGQAKSSCNTKTVMTRFPPDIVDFAEMFVALQEKRHRADYAPFDLFYKSEIQQDIAGARDVIARFQRVPKKDRRAFCAFVLFRNRPA